MPGREKMPETLKRSPKHAQDIYAKALEAAIEEYGDGRRAHMTAFAAVKSKYTKSGDKWVAK